MEPEFSALREIRIDSLKKMIDQGAAGTVEGRSPFRNTTTNLKSLIMLERFTKDPDLLDLAESARRLLDMPISEGDGKDQESVPFRVLGDKRSFEATKLGNGFDFEAYQNLGHALEEISKLGERSATLLKQKFPEPLSSYVAPGKKEASSSKWSGTEQDKKGLPMFPRQLHRFLRRN
jgi:hypothetical protein